ASPDQRTEALALRTLRLDLRPRQAPAIGRLAAEENVATGLVAAERPAAAAVAQATRVPRGTMRAHFVQHHRGRILVLDLVHEKHRQPGLRVDQLLLRA